MPLLSDSEKNFINSQVKKARIYLAFCYLDIAAVIGIIIYMLVSQHIDATRAVLAIILLINARSNLRQYKLAEILKKYPV